MSEPPVYHHRRHDPVTWICVLFTANFFLMRISVPDLNISVSTPLTLLWLILAWRAHIIVIEPRRTALWLAASGVSALATLGQVLWVPSLFVSINSWGLWIVTWLPAAFMMADRTQATYQRLLRAITTLGLVFASISVAFIGTQMVGIPYRDYLSEWLPSNMLVADFNTSYALYYGSSLYKSNGWFTLEPSFMSFILGLCILAALYTRARTWKLLLLLLGMIATAAGSGFFIVLVGVIVMLGFRQWRLLHRYVIPTLVLAAIVIPTQIGQVIIARLSESSTGGSSTSLRTFEPYEYLWPKWTQEPAITLFGGGPGSSRHVIDGSGVHGLLVPTVGKVLFDYGLIAGALLTVLVVVSYVKAIEPAIAYSVLASMLILQPPAQPLIIPAFLLSTLWAPALPGNKLAGTKDDEEPDAPPGGNDDGEAGGNGTAGPARTQAVHRDPERSL